MFNRSIETDYDIAYYKRRIQSCVNEIEESVRLLLAVGYNPHVEMGDAEDQMAVQKEYCYLHKY